MLIPAESAAKALFDVAAALLVGVCGARWWVTPTLGSAHERREQDRRLARVGAAAAQLALIAAALRLLTHSIAAFEGASQPISESLRIIAVESLWGERWRWHLLAALAWMAFRRASDGSSGSWCLASIASAGTAASTVLLGHGVVNPARVALHAGHVLAAGLWLGSLGAIVLASPAARRGGDNVHDKRSRLLSAFARLARPSAALLAGTGAYAAWTYVGTVELLWRSTYGRLLLAKLLAVLGVATCGYMNWRRYRREMAHAIVNAADSDRNHARGAPDSLVTVELALGLLVIVVTSMLATTQHP